MYKYIFIYAFSFLFHYIIDFGELTTWWSIFSLAVPALGIGQAALSLTSPLFITSLIMYISGVPILEKSHEERYGHNKEFLAYKQRTNLLVPLPKFISSISSNKDL